MSQEETQRLWKEIIEQLQPRSPLRRGLIGNGAGTVEVDGMPNWSWIRYQENQDRLSMVRCFLGYLEDDTPVIVGKLYPDDEFEQVLGVYWGPYSMGVSDATGALYRVPPHGESHHGTYGSDPAWIDYANMTFGLVIPTDPFSMLVEVLPFIYSFNLQTLDFDGDTVNLSSDVPGSGHLYVLVYFDPDSVTVSYAVGDAVNLAAPPIVPALTDLNAIPLGVVRLYNGQTEITFEETWQRKLMLGGVGSDAVTALQSIVVHEGDVVTNDGEVVWAT